jgi:uncharacterized membrane protein
MPDQTDPPLQETPEATPPPPRGPETSGLQPNIAAGLATLFSIIGGIVFLVIEKKNAFVRFYAMQAIFLGAASFALGIALNILSAILGHLPGLGALGIILTSLVSLVVSLAFFVLYIITIIKAFSGEEWEIPYLGAMARKQLKSSPI